MSSWELSESGTAQCAANLGAIQRHVPPKCVCIALADVRNSGINSTASTVQVSSVCALDHPELAVEARSYPY